jgi:hypothetical protein
MPELLEKPSGTVAALFAALTLFGASVAVRAIDGGPLLSAADRDRERGAVQEPMQLLGRSASARVAELDLRINKDLRPEWLRLRKAIFQLPRCPRTGEWLDSSDGLAFERLFNELRRGNRDEALAGLVLLTELARRTEWEPGLLARVQDAERLSNLQGEWLRTWSARAAQDAQLSDPALATLLLHARVERATYVRTIRRDRDRQERATEAFRRLLEDTQGQPSVFARALDVRHPGLVTGMRERKDALEALDTAAGQLFPGLNGECK